MSAIGIAATPLFRAGGDPYVCISKAVDELPRFWRIAAKEVLGFLVDLERTEGLDERVTDKRIADATGWSMSFVQKGLHALHVVLGKLGKPVIHRRRANGRRLITFIRGLAPRGNPATKPAPPAPPQTEFETTSTVPQGPSTSPLESIDADHPLIKRGMALIPDATAERIAAAIAVYSAEWVAKALDRVERRNRKPGMTPVRGFIFVLRTLENWRKEGGAPADDPARPAPTATPRPTPTADEEPPRRMTAEELAQLVAQCQEGPPALRTLGRVQLRKALAEGLIPAELVPTIPTDLADPHRRE